MDVFFSRRCAQAGADPNNPHSSRTWNLASLESGKGVAGILLLRMVSFVLFACWDATDSACDVVRAHTTGSEACALSAPDVSKCNPRLHCMEAQVVGSRRLKHCKRRRCCVVSAVKASIEIDRQAYAIHDAGSRLGKWHSKCLQASILALCSSPALRKALLSIFCTDAIITLAPV